MNEHNFFYYVFCEHGFPSSKRVFSGVMFLVCMMLLIIFAIREGCTDNVKDLIELTEILAGSLAGISSITSIWKSNKTIPPQTPPKEEKEET